MAHFINLVSSSSPSVVGSKSENHPSPLNINRNKDENSIINISSPLSAQFKSKVKVNSSNSSSSLSLFNSSSQIVNKDYEKFKKEWRINRPLSSEEEDNNDNKEDEKISLSSFFHSPVGLKRRRASDSFNIIEISKASPILQRKNKIFKNKIEAINSIRLFMSESMAEAYESELRRRFNDRQMNQCINCDCLKIIIPSEMASFRWKFCNDSNNQQEEDSEEFLNEKIFVIDSEMIWDEYISTQRYEEFLKIYNEPNVLLYFINWKRASQKHTSLLNKQFKQILNNETGCSIRTIIPANQLENEFFLSAAKLRLQVNFGTSSHQTSSLVDLIDFIIESTRVIALKYYLKGTESILNSNLTLSKDVKVKCGKDSKDSWSKILSQIPRVTPQISNLIISKYPSFVSLMKEYDRISAEEGETLLAELRFDDTRRLGPVISRRIFNHFRR